MRRTGEAAVLYIWTVSPRQKTSLLFFFFSIYEVHTIGRSLTTFFIQFHSVALSWQQIITLYGGVGGGDFDTEKRNSGKSGTISHATGPIWVVLLTRRRPMRSYWFSCHEPNNKYKKKKKKRGWLEGYISPPRVDTVRKSVGIARVGPKY